MEAIPLRFRQRIIELYDQGLQTRQIAEMLGTCHSGTRRIRQYLRERGTLEPAKPRGGYDSGLTEPLRRQLRALVSADPGATRQELRDRLNVSVDVPHGGSLAEEVGAGAKKKSLHAAEQDRPDVHARRQAWHDQLKNVPVEKLVFLDESGARTNMTRLYGRAPVGQRVVSKVPHGH